MKIEFQLKRKLILCRIKKEFYYEESPRDNQIVSATLHKDRGEITVAIDIDRLNDYFLTKIKDQ